MNSPHNDFTIGEGWKTRILSSKLFIYLFSCLPSPEFRVNLHIVMEGFGLEFVAKKTNGATLKIFCSRRILVD